MPLDFSRKVLSASWSCLLPATQFATSIVKFSKLVYTIREVVYSHRFLSLEQLTEESYTILSHFNPGRLWQCWVLQRQPFIENNVPGASTPIMWREASLWWFWVKSKLLRLVDSCILCRWGSKAIFIWDMACLTLIAMPCARYFDLNLVTGTGRSVACTVVLTSGSLILKLLAEVL